MTRSPRLKVLCLLLCAANTGALGGQQPTNKPSGPHAAAPAAARAHAPETTISSAARIDPPQPQFTMPAGKTLVFSAEWRLFNAGMASIRIEEANGQHIITGTADATGAVGLLYHVHDVFETFIDPKSFCSQALKKHTEEGFRRLDTSIAFDYPRKKSVLDETNQKTKSTKREENDIPNCVTDVIGGFYYLASQKLEPGDVFTFPLNDGGKTADVSATVEEREEVKVPAGTYKTIRVSAEAITGPRKGKGKIWVWYSDDAAHTPVQMRAKLAWGTLTFKLQRIDQNKPTASATAGGSARSTAAATADGR